MRFQNLEGQTKSFMVFSKVPYLNRRFCVRIEGTRGEKFSAKVHLIGEYSNFYLSGIDPGKSKMGL